MATKRSRAEINAIHMWLWWVSFRVALDGGSSVIGAYKAAQKATARLYA